jgi:hypothetical protein
MLHPTKNQDPKKLYLRGQFFTCTPLDLSFTRSVKKLFLIDYPIIKGLILAFLLIIFPPVIIIIMGIILISLLFKLLYYLVSKVDFILKNKKEFVYVEIKIFIKYIIKYLIIIISFSFILAKLIALFDLIPKGFLDNNIF